MSEARGPLVLKDAGYTLPATRRGPARIVLDGANLTVEPAERVGLIGPNGGGKTTVLKVLAGLLRLRSGSLRNGSLDAASPRQGYQRSVHMILGGPFGFYPRLSGLENLRFMSGVFGRFLSVDQAHVVLDTVGLTAADARVLFAKYSLGMRQRLHLGAALADRDANVWLMDEPTNGLDTDGRDLLTRVVIGAGLASADVSKVIVSHDRTFLDDVCHRVVELDRGALVA